MPGLSNVNRSVPELSDNPKHILILGTRVNDGSILTWNHHLAPDEPKVQLQHILVTFTIYKNCSILYHF